MSTFRKPLLFALAGVTALTIWGWLPYQSAQSVASPAAAPASRASSEGGQTIVTLDEATQKLSGIESDVLTATNQ
jgi:multidrug efflux system membrane fusion protein